MIEQMLERLSRLRPRDYKYIEEKYHFIIPEYNRTISPKSFIKIFEKDYELAVSVCGNKWTQEEVDYIIELLEKIPGEYMKNIINVQPEILKTNLLEKIDAKSVSNNPKSYYQLHLQLEDKLLELLELIKKEQPKAVESSVYIASLYSDLGLEISDLCEITKSFNENWIKIQPKMEFLTKITDKSTLLNLLVEIKNNNVDKVVEVLDFMENNNIFQIRSECFPMILNHTSKKSLSKKIKDNSELIELITKEKNITTFHKIIEDYIEFTPFEIMCEHIKSETAEVKGEYNYLKLKIVEDLLKVPYGSIERFEPSTKDIEKIAKRYSDNEILFVLDLLNMLNNCLPYPEEYKKIYYEYKKKISISGNQMIDKFKEYYCENLNEGLFDPKKIPDEEGEYEKYRVEYIDYKEKKIKKIVLWDPDFYMDISNIVNWEGNNIKDPKIIELSKKIISNPKLFGSVVDGSNTNCTSLINAMQMRTFSTPVVTGGYSYIDPQRIIVAMAQDANTEDNVSDGIFRNMEPKEDLLPRTTGEFYSGKYNEITSFKEYSIDNQMVKKNVFDYMLLNQGSLKLPSYEDTLKWAYIHNIPVVELDNEKIYKYYKGILKEYIEKCHNDNEILDLNGCKKIIDMIRVLNTFGKVENYISLFKESFEYALNLKNKQQFLTEENYDELFRILEFLKEKREFKTDEWIDKIEQEFNDKKFEVRKNM